MSLINPDHGPMASWGFFFSHRLGYRLQGKDGARGNHPRDFELASWTTTHPGEQSEQRAVAR